MVPMNLRVRMVMMEMCNSLQWAPCARGEADYKVRANSFKRSFDDRYFPVPDIAPPRRPLVARLDCRVDRDHGAGRRRYAAYRSRAFDCRMEAGHWHAAAVQSGAMDPGVRSLQDHPAISRTQRRHESCRVQDHFLVGMEPPSARARDRGCLSAAVSLVPVAWRFERGAEATAVAYLRSRYPAGRGRLVDGGVRTFAAGGSLAVSTGHSFGAGASHFCGGGLDAAPAGRPAAIGRILAAEDHRCGSGGGDLCAALFRRVGRWSACGARLQYMAGH